MAILLYETDDDQFAERALLALKIAGIASYHWGPAIMGDGTGRGRTGGKAGIYIEREVDYRVANDILIRLGAARAKRIRLPASRTNRLLIFLYLAALLALMTFLFRSG
jgi:hypothetical protein